MKKIKIFLASSSELESDRQQFEVFINRKNKEWIDRGVFFDLEKWEDFLDAMSQTRMQDEYNKVILQCDMFVMLFHTKVGKYTEEEFEIAFGKFKNNGKPLIFTYFKDAEVSHISSICKQDMQSLWAFQEKLKELGHFQTIYKNIDELKYKFNAQLDKIPFCSFIEAEHPADGEEHAEDNQAKINRSINKGDNDLEIIKKEVRESDWKSLIERIKKGKCLLLIGPECSTYIIDGLKNLLIKNMSSELVENNINESTKHCNLFQISESYLRHTDYDNEDLYNVVSDFYKSFQNEQSDILYDNLAELPFHLIISSTHDDKLYCALKQKREKVYYEYYSIHGKQKQIEYEVTAKTPLYYNLYGSIENPESLILTESQLLEFLVAIIKGEPMLPSYITDQIKNVPSILFLGFGLKEWYLKILLHVLHNEKNDKRSFAFERFSRISKIEHQSIFYYYNIGRKISMYDVEPTVFVQELATRYKQSIKAMETDVEVLATSENLQEINQRKKPKIFICHAQEDRKLAISLLEQLSKAGFDPCIDKENIKIGDTDDSVIKDMINEDINYFVVLNTPTLCNIVESYAYYEIEMALKRSKYFAAGIRFIIPIIYNNCSLLPSLMEIQGTIVESNGFFNRLVNTIKVDWKSKRGYAYNACE